MTARDGSRLEYDDRHYCKNCGFELPELLVDGPIAGGDSEYAPVERCGACEAKRWLIAAKRAAAESADGAE